MSKKQSRLLIRILHLAKWSTKMAFRSSKPAAITYFIVSILRGFNSLLYAYVFARIIDLSINTALYGYKSAWDILTPLLLLFGYQAFARIIELLTDFCRNVLFQRASYTLEIFYAQKLKNIGIKNLEDSKVANKVSRVSNQLSDGLSFYIRINELIFALVKFISAAVAVIVSLPPEITIILIICGIPNAYFEYIMVAKDWEWYKSNTEDRRRHYGIMGYLTTPKLLLEVLITDSFRFLTSKYGGFFKPYTDRRLGLIRQRYMLDFLGTVIRTSGVLYTFFIILKKVATGVVTVGQMTFLISVTETFTSAIESITTTFTTLTELATRFEEAVQVFEMKEKRSTGKIKLEAEGHFPKIEFQDVSFSYPGTEKLVLKNVSFVLEPGQKLALVGHNGAGKTTLVKLLSKVYTPTSGKILIDDIDLKNIDTESWYRMIGVLFQEFNNYTELTVRDNVDVGDGTVDNRDERIIQALKDADAWDFVQEYKNGLDTILDERYTGGIRPSWGQWQKIAIARFFYRNTPVVIFDEPTAAIDAISEYKIFNRIYKYLDKKSVVIVSHRFSTVRNANIILVIEKGKIIERGTHQELLALNGKYAEAFKLQAEGYN